MTELWQEFRVEASSKIVDEVGGSKLDWVNCGHVWAQCTGFESRSTHGSNGFRRRRTVTLKILHSDFAFDAEDLRLRDVQGVVLTIETVKTLGSQGFELVCRKEGL